MNLLSLIIPVYNRPNEVRELLESLVLQRDKNFEVILVEDGSTEKSDFLLTEFSDRLKISYHYKTNSGPGTTRNYGCERATGDYFIFLDSDVILPPQYTETIQKELKEEKCDAFGGPDAAHPSFTLVQKAINYSMTSVLTTGGIRGKKSSVEKFHPRSFNMGISRTVFEKTKGFSGMRFGEDIDLSIRIVKEGFNTRLFPDSFVYHKRRNTLKSFFKQINNSGIARINLYLLHPESLKLFHFLPALFVLGHLFLLVGALIWNIQLLLLPLIFALVVLIDSSLQNRCLRVGFLSIASVYIQHFAYGLGFIRAFIERLVLRRGEFQAYRGNFYK